MRYFKHENNALTMPGRMWAGGRTSLFGLRGFGQTDPVLDEEPDEDPAAMDAAAKEVEATVGGNSVGTITFYGTGGIQTSGDVAGAWWTGMESALGLANGGLAPDVLAATQAQAKSLRIWQWAALLGIPAAGVAAWFAAKRWGR
jgi:hypothetical protein